MADKGMKTTAAAGMGVPPVGSELRQIILGDGPIAGEIKKALGVFNPRMIGTKERLSMRLDPDVAFGLAIVRSPIIAAEWTVDGRDEEIKAFTNQALAPVYRSLAMGASNSIALGNIVLEKVWTGGPFEVDVDDIDTGSSTTKTYSSAWTYERFKPIDPRTYSFLLKDDRIAGVSQYQLAGTKFAEPRLVGMEKIFHWPFRIEDVFGSPWGFSLLDQAYEPWYFKTALSLICNRYFEQFASPPVKARGYNSIKTSDGRIVDGFKFLLDQIASIRSGGGVVLPNDLVKGTDKFAWDFEFLLSDQRGQMFDARLLALTTQILRAMWITDKAATAGNGTGSLAQATEHGERLDQMLELMVKEWLDYLNEQIVKPLVVYNFGEERARQSKTAVRIAGLTTGKRMLYSDLMKAVIAAEASVGGTGRPQFIDLLEMKAIAKEAGVPLKPIDDVQELIGANDRPAMGAQQLDASGNPIPPQDEAAVGAELQKQGVEDPATGKPAPPKPKPK